MNEVRMEPLPDREKRKIAQEVKENFTVARLLPDPATLMVQGQNFAVISFVSPHSETENAEWKEIDDFLTKKRFSKAARIKFMNLIHEKYKLIMKMRGCFRTEEEAEAWSKNRIGTSEGIATYTVPMYDYFLPPNKYDKRNAQMKKEYADEKANDFYKKKRIEQEINQRSFARQMEIFRETVKKNNLEWEALSQEEKEELLAKDKKKESTIEGVKIDKILSDDRIQKVMKQDTFATLRDIAQHLEIDQNRLFEGWAKMNAERKMKEKEEEEKKMEELEDSKMVLDK